MRVAVYVCMCACLYVCVRVCRKGQQVSVLYEGEWWPSEILTVHRGGKGYRVHYFDDGQCDNYVCMVHVCVCVHGACMCTCIHAWCMCVRAYMVHVCTCVWRMCVRVYMVHVCTCVWRMCARVYMAHVCTCVWRQKTAPSQTSPRIESAPV